MINSKDCGRKVLWIIYGYCPCICVRKTTKIRSHDTQNLRKESIPEFFPNTKSRSVRYSIAICVPASCTLSNGILALQASGTWRLPVTYVTRLCGMVPDTSAFHLTSSYIVKFRIAEGRVMFVWISYCGLLYSAHRISVCTASNVTTTGGPLPGWNLEG
jgi:hypothetical protein